MNLWNDAWSSFAESRAAQYQGFWCFGVVSCELFHAHYELTLALWLTLPRSSTMKAPQVQVQICFVCLCLRCVPPYMDHGCFCLHISDPSIAAVTMTWLSCCVATQFPYSTGSLADDNWYAKYWRFGFSFFWHYHSSLWVSHETVTWVIVTGVSAGLASKLRRRPCQRGRTIRRRNSPHQLLRSGFELQQHRFKEWLVW